ncbi:glycosyltransferase family 2 protein [uncultured Pontibacter sp.]|uniref:glycosyltransferase family 2 protein n=1 Tax=uncultured Pontibacter sp. TaxID=453356 RepID=UPI002633E442|nr:glycosyltransferase family 2 protein [uncultured Pontibacter sp.]
MKTKVSIIIPTYNRGYILSETIKSVIIQTYSNWEVLVVDDGSSDNTESIVTLFNEQDKRIKYLKRPNDRLKGANACRNYGLEMSTGQFIKWLDSDDKLHEKCLELQLANLLANNSNVNLCLARFFGVENGEVILFEKLWSDVLLTENITKDLITSRLQWQTATGLWGKDIFDKPPFDERIQNSQEWLFNIKLSLKPEIKISTLNKSLVYIRTHIGSMSNESNKKGRYYFYAALARYYAVNLIGNKNLGNEIKLYLFKKFLWYQAFTLYKGSPSGFIKLLTYWPSFLIKILSH